MLSMQTRSNEAMALLTGSMLATSDEERAIRDAVGGIARSFGPDYYQQLVATGVERMWLSR